MLKVGKEDVSATTEALRTTFESSGVAGELRKINVVADHHEKINILWLLPVGAHRAKQANALDARNLTCGSDELGSQ